MNNEEIKRRLNDRIDRDENFAEDIDAALEAEDDDWLYALIIAVVGKVIDAIWRKIRDWLR